MQSAPRTEVSPQNWKKITPFLLALCGIFYGASQLFRMFWFDEVLTVNLILNLPLEKIYFAYEIPNNHILFTLLEKIWFSAAGTLLPQTYWLFRLAVLLTGGAALFFLSRELLKKYSILPVCAVCGAFAVSSVWAMYSTAVRGYMLGFLLTVLSLITLKRCMRTHHPFRAGILYGICCLLSVATLPSNLAALAGVSLYFFPEAFRKKAWKHWSLSLFLPPLALGIVYLPILGKFLGCIRLGEGWFSRTNAFYVMYSGAFFPAAVLVIFAMTAGLIMFLCCREREVKIQLLCDLLILLLPAGAILFMKTIPFPRVFFPLTAVWLCIGVRYMAYWKRITGKNRMLLWLPLLLQGFWSCFFFQSRAERAGDFLYGSGGRGDDYIAPYYARSDFEPGKVIRFIREQSRDGREVYFFATFDADAPSLLFAAQLQGLEEGILRADTLNRPKTLRFDLLNGEKYIIANGRDDLHRTLARFAFKDALPVKKYGLQKIYKVIP